MRGTWLWLVCVLLLGCGRMVAGTDTQATWLKQCSTSTECGDLTCVCGHCAEPCPWGRCAASGTTCQPDTSGAARALCGATPVAVCLTACDESHACPAGQGCNGGACIPVPDTGTGGTGGAGGSVDASGTGGAAGSVDANSTGGAGGSVDASSTGGAGGTLDASVAGGAGGTLDAGDAGAGGAVDANIGIDSGLDCVARIAAGGHRCALKRDGSVWCWGNNETGQIGDGTTVYRYPPVKAIDFGNAVAIYAGGAHTCARTSDGSVWCWGANDHGQLGDGTATDRHAPIRITAPGTGVVDLVLGLAYTCAHKTDGSVWCWGANDHGQLGDGTVIDSSLPVRVAALGTGVVDIAATTRHTCARKTDGSVWCWGANDFGQLGDGTMTDRRAPVLVGSLGAGVVQIAAAAAHTCARKADASVWCWGDGTGDGGLSQPFPVQIAGLGTGVDWIAAGDYQTCAHKVDRSVWCWGANYAGQLADGTNTDSRGRPVHAAQLDTDVVELAIGPLSSVSGARLCARTTDGVVCWPPGDRFNLLSEEEARVPAQVAGLCRSAARVWTDAGVRDELDAGRASDDAPPSDAGADACDPLAMAPVPGPPQLPFAVDQYFEPWAHNSFLEYVDVPTHFTMLADGCAHPPGVTPVAGAKCWVITIEPGTPDAGRAMTDTTWSSFTYPFPAIPLGAGRVRFVAWGARGGEHVSFRAGQGEGVQVSTDVVLGQTPQYYHLDLAGIDYHCYGVRDAFGWSVNADTAFPMEFYVDDIEWQ